MLAVHWAPVSRTKVILKNGIRKSKAGLYCFPLTGHFSLDRWWVRFFHQYGACHKKKYNGFVFRLRELDFPAYFGHWIGATVKDDFEKKITDLETFEKEYRSLIMWRMGAALAGNRNLGGEIFERERQLAYQQQTALFLQLAEEKIWRSPRALAERLNDLHFMTYTLEDYQVVLSHSISPKRILKILPQGSDFGRVIRQKKKYGS